MALKPQGLHKA